MIFEEENAPHCDYGDCKLEENDENIDESVLKVGTEEKSHLSHTEIGQWLYVSLKDHRNKYSEEGILPYQSWGRPISDQPKQT